MKRVAFALAFMLGLGGPVGAQTAAEPGLEFYRVGDLALERGEVIHDFSIAYMTQGTLNASRSNAVLMCKNRYFTCRTLSDPVDPNGPAQDCLSDSAAVKTCAFGAPLRGGGS